MADFSALKTAIQTYIKQNGNEEITGEILQEILLSVVTTLGDSAINDLVTALANEVAARQNADGTLQQNITNEATARGNADTALGGRIDDEATARGNGDTALSNRLGSTITAQNTAADQIDAEAEAREAADTALQGLIDGITDNIENGYVYAGIATPSSTPATGKVFYLALTAGTYTNFGSTVVSQGINILKYNGSAWSLDAFIDIDDSLNYKSKNLITSGVVADEVGGFIYDVTPTIEQGSLNSAGEVLVANNRLRTVNYIECDSITINAGIGKVSVFGYSDNECKGYVDWTTGEHTYKIDGATKYKVVFAYTDNSTISVADYSSLNVSINIFSLGKIKFASGEYLRAVGIDNELIENSRNLITSGAVKVVTQKLYDNLQDTKCLLSGALSDYSIVAGYAIDEDGHIIRQDDYSYTTDIYVVNGNFSLTIQKSEIAGYTRIHGYKNGVWQEQLIVLPAGKSGKIDIKFRITQNIDSIKISYSNTTTTLLSIRLDKPITATPISVELEEGSYVSSANRYGLFASGNRLLSYINKKPITTGSGNKIIIPSTKIEARNVKLYYRNSDGVTISSSEINNVTADIIDSIPDSTYYTDVEISKYKDIPLNSVIVEGKAISENGTVETNPDYSYINSTEVSNGAYMLLGNRSYVAGYTRIHGYKNGVWIKQIAFSKSTEVGDFKIYFSVENNEVDAIKISYRNDSTTIYSLNKFDNILNEPIDIAFLNCIEVPKEIKRVYKNSSSPIINPFTVGGPDELLSCMCYMLPPNYSHNGNKTPLIVWFDGSAGYPSLTSTFQNNKLPGLSYMRDEGFAVMQVFAWGAEYAISCPNCGSDMPYPTRTCLRTIKAAIEFMVDRYNIDAENVHVVSKSFGGIISSYFTMFPIWNFKSIGMFSPCIDVLSMRGRFLGGRLALIQDLNLQGNYVEDFKDISLNGDTQTGVENYFFSPRCQNLWLENFTKLMSINAAWIRVCEAGYNEKYLESLADARAWWNTEGASVPDKYDADVYTNTDRHRVGKVPCKLWIATHDVDTPHQIMIEFVEQLKNCGCYAEATILEGGHHSSPDFDYTESVTTKLGIYYESVAIGWRENIEWIRRNSVGSIE